MGGLFMSDPVQMTDEECAAIYENPGADHWRDALCMEKTAPFGAAGGVYPAYKIRTGIAADEDGFTGPSLSLG